MNGSLWDDRFFQFARNGRWGTCVECPRSGAHVFPEFCAHTDRSDHLLTVDQLAENFKIGLATAE